MLAETRACTFRRARSGSLPAALVMQPARPSSQAPPDCRLWTSNPCVTFLWHVRAWPQRSPQQPFRPLVPLIRGQPALPIRGLQCPHLDTSRLSRERGAIARWSRCHGVMSTAGLHLRGLCRRPQRHVLRRSPHLQGTRTCRGIKGPRIERLRQEQTGLDELLRGTMP